MTGATLFSGIMAPEQAAPGIDWKWCAEIDREACATIAYRFPGHPNLGDVTASDFLERASGYGPIDLLVFGSPCQSFSVAGRRLGLDDPRGNLALHALAVVAHLRPTWFTFENVPGLFSSWSDTEDEGREESDFAVWLSAVEDCGYHVAWRVLDAQFAGVPQRRRRIFACGHTRAWQYPAAVLLIPEGVPWNHKTRGKTRERSSRPANASSRLRRLWEQLDKAFGEGPQSPQPRRPDEIRSVDFRNSSTGDIAHAMQSKPNGGQSLHCTPSVLEPVDPQLYAMQAIGEYEDKGVASATKARDYKDATDLIAHSLRGDGFDASEDGAGRTTLVPETFPTLRSCGAGVERVGNPGVEHEQYIPMLADPIIAHEGKVWTHEGRNNFRLRNCIPAPAYGIHAETTPKIGEDLHPTLRGRELGGGSMDVVAYQNTGQSWWKESEVAAPVRDGGAGSGPKEANVVAEPVCLNPGETQRRKIYDADCNAPTLSAEEGRGHGVPMVFQERRHKGDVDLDVREGSAYSVLAPAGGGRRQEMNICIPILEPGCRTGPSSEDDPKCGLGVGNPGDPMYTLEESKVHAVATAYTITSGNRNPSRADHGDLYLNETSVASPIDAAGANPVCQQGGMAIVEPPLAFVQDQEGQVRLQGDGDLSGTLSARGPRVANQETFLAFAQNTRDEVRLQGGDGEISGAISADEGMKQRTYLAFEPRIARNGRGAPEDVVPPLKAESGRTGKGDSAPCVATGFYGNLGSHGGGVHEDMAPALKAGTHENLSAVAFDAYNQTETGDVSQTLRRGNGNPIGGAMPAVAQHWAVRRLTPRETERLQGLPDDFTLIPWRGALMADGPRYRQVGNSMALPCIGWILERLQKVHEVYG